jgi:prefoldin subunit 5
VGGDEFISKQEYVPAKIEVSEDLLIPLDARVAALNLSGDALKIYEDKYLQDKTRRESMIKAAADKAAADKAAAIKKTALICVKGKLTKKITATKPKCPSGYKVKK